MEVTSLYREPEIEPELHFGAVEFHDVFKIYSGGVETVALRGLDLRIETGELVAVLGPSGSGKTTLLHLAAALEQASAGDVRAAGHSLARLGETELAEYRARLVALVFQRDNLWPELTALENVAVSLRLAGKDDVERRALGALFEFGLERQARHRSGLLSGGEQQRVAIAAAAAREAPLVLADEPTGELDLAAERVVVDSLRRLRDDHGSTVITVTHSQRLARAADRVVEIRDGRVL